MGDMVKLIYSMTMSLDGYVADTDGRFDWARPDEEVHAFFNDLARPIGTQLYGRRMYEVMSYWESSQATDDESPAMREFGVLWRASDKIVYSATLSSVNTSRTQLERDFDPKAIGQLKARASRELCIGGATLAASAFAAGLIDECHLMLAPVIVGGGTRALPDGVRSTLDMLETRHFSNGMVYLRYGVAAGLAR